MHATHRSTTLADVTFWVSSHYGLVGMCSIGKKIHWCNVWHNWKHAREIPSRIQLLSHYGCHSNQSIAKSKKQTKKCLHSILAKTWPGRSLDMTGLGGWGWRQDHTHLGKPYCKAVYDTYHCRSDNVHKTILTSACAIQFSSTPMGWPQA